MREPLVSDSVKVFFSYSHKDEKMRVKLENHLSVLRREKKISAWHDRKIQPGDEWRGQLDQNLESAKLILLLITADFLNSDYCFDIEMKRALEKHQSGEARVIPIILRPCDWVRSPFGKLQALPRDGKPVSDWTTHDHAFNEIARGLRRIVEDMCRTVTTGHSIHGTSVELADGSTLIKNPYAIYTNDKPIVSEEIAKKLDRMRLLNAVFKSEPDDVEESLYAEYRLLLEETVEVFLPLVTMLVKSGILTASINIEDIDDIDKYATLTGEPTVVFDNGNIWIDTEFAGGVIRNKAVNKPEPKPKPVKKWGCYQFEGDKELYCPGCYSQGKMSPTTRVNSSMRQCLVCKAAIGSG